MNKFAVTDVATDQVFVVGNNKYYWRIIEVTSTDEKGQLCKKHKIGLSRFWFNSQSNRWLPSKSHVFLPTEAFLKLKNSLERIAFHIESETDTQIDDGYSDELHNVDQLTATTGDPVDDVVSGTPALVERKRRRPTGVCRPFNKASAADTPKGTKEAQRNAAKAGSTGRKTKASKVSKVVSYDCDSEESSAADDTATCSKQYDDCT